MVENTIYRAEKNIDKDCSLKIYGDSDKFLISFKDGKFIENIEVRIKGYDYEIFKSVGCCRLDEFNLTYFKPQGIPNYCRDEVIRTVEVSFPILDHRKLEKTLIEFNNSDFQKE